MSIKEIEQIYSYYEVDALFPKDFSPSSGAEEAAFPSQVQPPSAFVADEQVISNISNL